MEKRKFDASRIFSEFGIYLVLVVMIIFLSFMSKTFFTTSNFLNILRQVSINGILAMGMTLILITGGIDLSVGSVLALAGVLGATFAHPEPAFPLIVPLAVGIGAGILCGCISGLLVSRTTISPFIVTMGMTSVARGLALLYTNGRPVTGQSAAFTFLGRGVVGPVTFPVILFVLICVLSIILLHRSRLGKYIFAVGGNENAAMVSGISVQKIKFFVYVYGGALCGLAGLLLASRTNAATPNAGEGYELDAIAAAVIGGCSLNGGQGSILGVFIGAAILGVIRNGFVLLSIPSSWQSITIGIVLVIACTLDQIQSKRRNK